MVIFSQSKNLSEGKFTRPPDERELKPDPPKRQPLVKPKLQSPLNETNEIELPPWLRGIQAQPVSTSPGRESAVKFVLPKQKSPRKKRRRNATLYDAVAGRVGRHGFKKKSAASKNRDTASTGERTLAPEEVLIRRPHYLNNRLKGEPYFAHERLPREMKLPTSDMLTALHAYAADFYKYGMQRTKPVNQRFDESALLAFGILAEELSKELMGPMGFRCLLDDPQHTDNEDVDNPIPDHLRTRKRRAEMLDDPNYRVEIRGGRARFVRTRKRRPKPDNATKKKAARRRRTVPTWADTHPEEMKALVAEQEMFRQRDKEKKEMERRERREKSRKEKGKKRVSK